MQRSFSIGDNITVNRVPGRNLTFTFCPDGKDRIWQKADRFAELIADYYQISVNNSSRTVIISHVLNELIENAIKYSRHSSDAVQLETLKNNDKLLIRITNKVSADLWRNFIDQCKILFQDDLKKLFVNRIHSLRKAESNSSAGIGLLLLKKDFNADIKFIFYEHSENNYSVSVIAELSLS